MTFFKTACRAAGLMLATGAILTGGIAAHATPPSYTYTDLHDFDHTGGNPQSKLLPDGQGNFYGLTGSNYTFGGDTILFEYTPGTGGAAGTFTVLNDFGPGTIRSGSDQSSGLTLGPDGTIYGTVLSGNGILFQYTPGAGGTPGTVTTLYTFTGGSYGYVPMGEIVLGADGRVYGTTPGGGASDEGTLYAYTPGIGGMPGTFATVHNFSGGHGDAGAPYAGVTLGPAGNLYGTTPVGGANSDGTLFQYTPDAGGGAGTLTILHSFGSGNDGVLPSSRVALDADGNVYGTTPYGGANSNGTLFEYSTGTGTLTTLYPFTGGSDGGAPRSGVILDGQGNLFGMNDGGVNYDGIVYKYALAANTLTPLYSFNRTDGSGPTVPLTLDDKGNLFGVTYSGGASNNGVLFEFAVPTPVLRYDADGDGHEDFLWRNSQNGKLAFWNMDDDARLADATFDGSTDPNWKLVGASDFDKDGKPDLLWQNLKTQQLAVWYMDGATRVSDLTFPGSTDSNWVVVSTADFDGDGHPDLLWRNIKTGDVAVWRLGGATGTDRMSDIAIETVPDLNWHIFGTGDYNGDGHPDILWQNVKTTEVSIWHMSNTTVIDKVIFATVGDPAWHIVGTGDYDTDNQPDILWRNSATLELSIWHMNDVTRGTTTTFPGSTDPAWTIVGIH